MTFLSRFEKSSGLSWINYNDPLEFHPDIITITIIIVIQGEITSRENVLMMRYIWMFNFNLFDYLVIH